MRIILWFLGFLVLSVLVPVGLAQAQALVAGEQQSADIPVILIE